MNPYVYSRGSKGLNVRKHQDGPCETLLQAVLKSSVSTAMAFAMVIFAAGSVATITALTYTEMVQADINFVTHISAHKVAAQKTSVQLAGIYKPEGKVLGDSTVNSLTATPVQCSGSFCWTDLSWTTSLSVGNFLIGVKEKPSISISYLGGPSLPQSPTAYRYVLAQADTEGENIFFGLYANNKGVGGSLLAAVNLPYHKTSAPVAPRVGSLVWLTTTDNTVYIVASGGLYGFPNEQTFNSWGYQFSQVSLANSAESTLPVLGIIPVKASVSCTSPLDQINNVCSSAGNASSTPGSLSGNARVGQLVWLTQTNNTVYIVASGGLYGFADLGTYNSWYGNNFSNTVLANATEASLPFLGLVPAKQSGCSNPLDQIAGTCSAATATGNSAINFSFWPLSGSSLVAGKDAWTFTLFNGKPGDMLSVDANFVNASGTASHIGNLAVCTIPQASTSIIPSSCVANAVPKITDVGTWSETVYINGVQKYANLVFNVIGGNTALSSANLIFSANNGALTAGKDSWTFNIQNANPGDEITAYSYKNGVWVGNFALCVVPKTVSGPIQPGSCTASSVTSASDVGVWDEIILDNGTQIGKVHFTVVDPAVPYVTAQPAGSYASSTPTFSFSANNGTLVAGKDSWTFNLSNAKPNDSLSVVAYKNSQFVGNLKICSVAPIANSPILPTTCILTSTPQSGDIGTWNEAVYINGIQAGNVSFQVIASAPGLGAGSASGTPTAILTANGNHNIVVNVGDTVNYVWQSTNGSTYNSSATVTSGVPAICSPSANTSWVANSASGNFSGQIQPWQAGCSYLVSYSVTSAAGTVAQDGDFITVNAASASSTLTAYPTSVNITAQAGSLAPAPQYLAVNPGSPSANWTARTNPGSLPGLTLSLNGSQGSSVSGSGVANLGISLSGPFVAGTYNGSITLTSGQQTQTVNITLTVSSNGYVYPTATLTANSSHTLNANIGDIINYSWQSTNGSSYSSNVVVTGGPNTCTGSSSWVANSASGNFSGAIQSWQAGCSYKITYQVTAISGYSAQDFVTVNVAAQVAANPSYAFSATSGNTLSAGKDSWTYTLSNGKSGSILSVDAFKNGSFSGHLNVCTVQYGSASCSASGTPQSADVGSWSETVFIDGVISGYVNFSVVP